MAGFRATACASAPIADGCVLDIGDATSMIRPKALKTWRREVRRWCELAIRRRPDGSSHISLLRATEKENHEWRGPTLRPLPDSTRHTTQKSHRYLIPFQPSLTSIILIGRVFFRRSGASGDGPMYHDAASPIVVKAAKILA